MWAAFFHKRVILPNCFEGRQKFYCHKDKLKALNLMFPKMKTLHRADWVYYSRWQCCCHLPHWAKPLGGCSCIQKRPFAINLMTILHRGRKGRLLQCKLAYQLNKEMLQRKCYRAFLMMFKQLNRCNTTWTVKWKTFIERLAKYCMQLKMVYLSNIACKRGVGNPCDWECHFQLVSHYQL